LTLRPTRCGIDATEGIIDDDAAATADRSGTPRAVAGRANAKSLACGGTGPQSGSIAVTEKGGMLTLKFKGTSLVPAEAATCGYTCQMVFTSGPEVSCGTVGANGKFSGKIELPLTTCFGFIPFFNTPSTGKCVPSTVP
jgi:hypothetical protein